ncbi:MAG TPA: DUF1175 family protein [Candidatus Solibacter sp.]|nr:DUF1175 family protein [Candidatus Solibacter sp.]
MKRAALLAIIAVVRTQAPAPRISVDSVRLLANGYDTATVLSSAPIASDNPHALTVIDSARTSNGWRTRLRAGVMPGVFLIRAGEARAAITLSPYLEDSAGDGTPDILRLDDPADQEAFRRWFTFLAEAQYFQPSERRPAEIDDCAALIRYAYREALRRHDSVWATAARLPFTPSFESVAKYQYPYTALGAALFRTPAGWAQFADAKTLRRMNTHFVSRDLARALPGDIIFYRQRDGESFHSMIFVGRSHFTRDRERYIVYHTGPDQNAFKRLAAGELLRYPEPEWRPFPSNPNFLGVYRWNIL